MYQADEKYGKVRMNSYLPTHRAVKFLNYFRSAGWHNCNSQYRQYYAEGIEGALLFFTVAGKGILYLGEKKYTLTAGTAALIPPHTPMSYFTDAGVDWEFYWINLYGAYAIQTTAYILEERETVFQIGNMAGCIEKINDLLLLNEEDKFRFEWEVSQKISQLLHEIVQGLFFISAETSSSYNLPVRIAAYIEQRYTEPIHMAQLSRSFYLSQNHLIRIFREATGYTPYEYLKRYRLLKACELLQTTDHTVEEIGATVGFPNNSNFIYQFRSQYGVTPCTYRQIFTPFGI